MLGEPLADEEEGCMLGGSLEVEGLSLGLMLSLPLGEALPLGASL